MQIAFPLLSIWLLESLTLSSLRPTHVLSYWIWKAKFQSYTVLLELLKHIVKRITDIHLWSYDGIQQSVVSHLHIFRNAP